MISLKSIDRQDKQFLLGAVIAPLVIWWCLVGRTKYSVKGMR